MTCRTHQAGSALIELAGALVVLVTLLTGIFQVGYTFYAYENLVHAVRAGARYASLRPAGSEDNREFALSVKRLVVYGNPHATGGKPVVAGLAPEHVDVIVGPDAATVSVRGFVINALFATFRLDGKPTVTFPLTRRVAQ
ncbi:MAG TPA: TadE family protein [Bryobacteraceae bacterium]|nr:TadE family protein [Bryobacteraceae bacterium]